MESIKNIGKLYNYMFRRRKIFHVAQIHKKVNENHLNDIKQQKKCYNMYNTNKFYSIELQSIELQVLITV